MQVGQTLFNPESQQSSFLFKPTPAYAPIQISPADRETIGTWLGAISTFESQGFEGYKQRSVELVNKYVAKKEEADLQSAESRKQVLSRLASVGGAAAKAIEAAASTGSRQGPKSVTNLEVGTVKVDNRVDSTTVIHNYNGNEEKSKGYSGAAKIIAVLGGLLGAYLFGKKIRQVEGKKEDLTEDLAKTAVLKSALKTLKENVQLTLSAGQTSPALKAMNQRIQEVVGKLEEILKHSSAVIQRHKEGVEGYWKGLLITVVGLCVGVVGIVADSPVLVVIGVIAGLYGLYRLGGVSGGEKKMLKRDQTDKEAIERLDGEANVYKQSISAEAIGSGPSAPPLSSDDEE